MTLAPADPRAAERAASLASTAVDQAHLAHYVDLYRDLHAHPELSMQERRTGSVVAARLRAAGCEVTEGVGDTGVVGVLRNGDGPVVMVRADMDALPIREETDLAYRSEQTALLHGREVPVMHACGHDMHGVSRRVGQRAQ
jgi:metal-dependent amidase/aminoacylase/carboxypeptidase family protein